MLMLGTLAKVTKAVSDDSMEKAIGDTVDKKTAEMNCKAYEKGRELVQ